MSGRVALFAVLLALTAAAPAQAANITVKQNTEPNSTQVFDFTAGGGLSPTTFQLDDDGFASNDFLNTRRFSGLAAGSGYSVAQTSTPPGYDPAQASCSDGSPPSNIDLSTEESVTCTFMSLLSTAGTITVVKDAEPNGLTGFGFLATGPTPPGHVGFTLQDNGPGLPGSPESSGFAVNPGSGYVVQESVPAEWFLVSASCSDGSPTFSIDVSPNEHVICTFLNQQFGTIRVVKEALPRDAQDFSFTAGGGLSPTSFVLDDDGGEAGTPSQRLFTGLTPGNGYSLAESVPAGWDQTSATCSDGSPVSNIDVSPGESITCTFTNTKRATLIARLDTQPDDPQDFSFTTGGGLTPATFDLDDDGNGTLPSEHVFSDVPAGSGYSLSQSLPPGWDQVSATCSNDSPTTDIELQVDETVICTFQTVRSDAARITVVKDTQPDYSQDFGFTAAGGIDPSSFSLDDDGDANPLAASRTFVADPGTYSISEDQNDPFGWAEGSATCSDGSSPSAIALGASERVTCTFVNSARNDLRDGGVKGDRDSFAPDLSADGRQLAFGSRANNLSPNQQDFGLLDTFVRDMGAAETRLASRADGMNGADSAAQEDDTRPSVSDDGRYVAFATYASGLVPGDTESNPNTITSDIYVRDLATGATTLVSRESGVSGAKAHGGSSSPSISADGRHVAFVSSADNLSPDGPFFMTRVYVRDLATASTQLVSRASGVAGAAGNNGSDQPSISADGRHVAFASNATNLDPGDGDTASDVYVRDLDTNQTTLASVATTVGDKGGGAFCCATSISADGTRVSFESASSNLSPADNDGYLDVYVRDLEAQTTTLASRATGAAGANSNGEAASLSSLSADGRYVSFGSSATNLDPADSDTTFDVYVRDLDANRTTLVSRADGPDGAKANAFSGATSISAHGRWIAFSSGARNLSPDDTDSANDIYVRDVLLNVTTLQSRGTVGYPRPQGATPVHLPLVPAYEPCIAGNRVHGPPLTFDSCHPPAESSSSLTLGTPDANGRPAAAVGSVRYRAVSNNVSLALNATDIRKRSDLTDYTGELRLEMPLRITDRRNTPSEVPAATVTDTSIYAVVPCTSTVDPSVGSTCSIATTINSLFPGAVQTGFRAIWELGQIVVHDGGSDGDGDTTGDNQPFLRQGIFVP